MPRMCVTSDLHVGITPEPTITALAHAIAAEQPDLTILAGDLGEGLTAFRRCLAWFSGLAGQLAVVAGNHDLWRHNGLSSETLWSTALPATTREAGALWLENDCWKQDGVGVAGSLAWYDYSACTGRPPWLPAAYYAKRKARIVRDATRLDPGWNDLVFAARVGACVAERLAALDADPSITAILVATHVPLFQAQLAQRPFQVSRESWAYFANFSLGTKVQTSPKVRVCHYSHSLSALEELYL